MYFMGQSCINIVINFLQQLEPNQNMPYLSPYHWLVLNIEFRNIPQKCTNFAEIETTWKTVGYSCIASYLTRLWLTEPACEVQTRAACTADWDVPCARPCAEPVPRTAALRPGCDRSSQSRLLLPPLENWSIQSRSPLTDRLHTSPADKHPGTLPSTSTMQNVTNTLLYVHKVSRTGI